MYIEVRNGRAELREPDNCRALDIRVSPEQRPTLDTALRDAGLGSWDGGAEADLSVSGLRVAAAAGDVGADWPERWDAMVGYAASKGWLTPDGTGVRAHLVDIAHG